MVSGARKKLSAAERKALHASVSAGLACEHLWEGRSIVNGTERPSDGSLTCHHDRRHRKKTAGAKARRREFRKVVREPDVDLAAAHAVIHVDVLAPGESRTRYVFDALLTASPLCSLPPLASSLLGRPRFQRIFDMPMGPTYGVKRRVSGRGAPGAA